jgi:hypothetical protein
VVVVTTDGGIFSAMVGGGGFSVPAAAAAARRSSDWITGVAHRRVPPATAPRLSRSRRVEPPLLC